MSTTMVTSFPASVDDSERKILRILAEHEAAAEQVHVRRRADDRLGSVTLVPGRQPVDVDVPTLRVTVMVESLVRGLCMRQCVGDACRQGVFRVAATVLRTRATTVTYTST